MTDRDLLQLQNAVILAIWGTGSAPSDCRTIAAKAVNAVLAHPNVRAILAEAEGKREAVELANANASAMYAERERYHQLRGLARAALDGDNSAMAELDAIAREVVICA